MNAFMGFIFVRGSAGSTHASPGHAHTGTVGAKQMWDSLTALTSEFCGQGLSVAGVAVLEPHPPVAARPVQVLGAEEVRVR